MPTILAHRGNVDGPSPSENRPAAIHAALQRGWGLELDIRRDGRGVFYVSHDAMPSAHGAEAAAVFALIRRYPSATIAVNVKELGYEADLVAFLDTAGVLAQSFLFDMELIEPVAGAAATALRRACPALGLAARVSDRGETIERALADDAAGIVWLDEFDGPWCTAADVAALRAAGRAVYAVSPDLHGRGAIEAQQRWIDFLDWDVAGICTDYPELLAQTIASRSIGAVA